MIVERADSNPWLNDRCKAAILRKNGAEGTVHFERERASCTQILNEERAAHVQKANEKLASLPKSSKQ